MDPKQMPMAAAGDVTSPQSPSGTGQQVKQQARRLADAVKERAITTSEDQKDRLSEQVGTLVQKLDGITAHEDGSEHSLPDELVDRGLGIMRKVQRVLEENSTQELIAKAEQQMKAHPGTVIAGCVALGFLGARLVRR